MPMRKSSTLKYLVNNYGNSTNYQVENELDVEFDQLLSEIDSQGYTPSERTVAKIIDFACSYDTEKTDSIGFVEMNLN